MSFQSDHRKDIERLIPGLRLQQPCGNGGYGSVYVAMEESVDRLLAVKYCPLKNGAGRERAGLKNYCRHMAGQRNLLNVYHVVVNDSELCYTMELADNLFPESSSDTYCADTLTSRIGRTRRLSLAEIVDYSLQLISAVEALHGAGLLHRDIKPDNILFVKGVLKLGDLGLVCEAELEHSIGGTPSHMPPERRRCPLDTRLTNNYQDDLYSLGITIYNMMSGRSSRFFPTLPVEVSKNPRLAPLNQFLLKACSDDPAKRFANIREFREAFEEDVVNLAARHRRRIILLLNATFALMLLLAIGGIIFYRQRLRIFSRNPQGELYPAAEAQSALPWWAQITPTMADSNIVFAEQFTDTTDSVSGDGWKLLRDGQDMRLIIEKIPIGKQNIEAYLQFSCGDADLVCIVSSDSDSATFSRRFTPSGTSAITAPPIQAQNTSGALSRQWGLRLLGKDGMLRAFANSMPISGTAKLPAATSDWSMEFRMTPKDGQPIRIEECCIFKAP